MARTKALGPTATTTTTTTMVLPPAACGGNDGGDPTTFEIFHFGDDGHEIVGHQEHAYEN